MTKYEEYKNQVKELREKMKSESKEVLKEISKEVFDKYPIENFSWRQYTVYFNDGDPCNFHAHTDSYSIEIEGLNSEDDDEEKFDEAREEISNKLDVFDEEDLESIFGDHVRVIVNRNGDIYVEEYICHD
jgi:hypothetical protein